MTKEQCVKEGRCDCQDCAFNSDKQACRDFRSVETELCPFCGDFPKCNNAEGCDNCPEYEKWLENEEKAILKGV